MTVPDVVRMIHRDDFLQWLYHPDEVGTEPTNSPVGIEFFALAFALKTLWRIAQINNKKIKNE